MNTDILKYFAVVYETQSVPRAAERISISTQGLGKSIRQLEEQCGTELFRKESGAMIPTPAAKAIYPEAIRLLEQEERLKETLKQCLSQSGIRFAVPDQYEIGYALKRSIYRYNEEFGTDIECVPVSYSDPVTEQDRILLEGECDYRIINRIFNQLDGFYTHTLCTISFVPVVNRNNPLASLSGVTWSDLRDQEIIVENAEYPYVQQVIATCRKAGFEPNIQVAEGDLFALQMIRREDHAVYFTKHASMFVRDDEQCEFRIPDLSPVISSNYIVQGRKEKWNPRFIAWLSEAMEREFR
ncbi:MAG: LysR family transcriptional regulator [Solobacterium sp.]|nr:LysR family transcriptional regulator [Solobacterium sp.]